MAKGTTRKEAVTLPTFSGIEKPGCSPFLEYPVWLKNWNQHIVDYEDKSRCNMLLSHLDKDALRQITGSENDYLAAMRKLNDYFGNKLKVIHDCTNEINNFPKVLQNDFKKLVELKTCIEMNYARLASLDLQSEMSNTQAMKGLEAKFPAIQQVEWTRYLSILPSERQLNVFPEFLTWLDKEGAVWSTMDSKSSVATTAKAKVNTTLYVNDGSTQSGDCNNCKKPGHYASHCPDRKSGSATRGRGGTAAKSGGRLPQHRKFHCAYCKDNSKRCSTNWCPLLRKLNYNERKTYLDANQDCEKCAGDCPKGACKAK